MKNKILVASLCTFLLAGCSSTTVMQTFDLDNGARVVADSSVKKTNKQISVAQPDALQTLDGQNIVIRGGGGSIAYLEKAQWSDRLTNIVQMRLIEALEGTNKFSGVGKPGDGLNARTQLITELREFGIVLQQQGKIAKVEIAAKLMDTQLGRIQKTKIFTATQPVVGHANADYAMALSQAFAEALQEIAQWVQ